MTYLNILILYLITFGTIALTFSIMPYITRRNVLFGVSVPPGAYDDTDAKKLRRTYLRRVLLWGALFTLAYFALAFTLEEDVMVYYTMAVFFGYLAVLFAVYVSVWKQAKRLKAEKKWASEGSDIVAADTSFYQNKLAVSPLWLLLYPVVIISSIVLGYLLYDKIPEMVPMQQDMAGNVTRYAQKSIRLIYFAPVMQGFISLIFGFIYIMMRNARPELDPGNLEASIKQNVIFRYRWSAYIVFGGMALMLVFFALQLTITAVIGMTVGFWISMAATVLLVAGAVALSVTTGQSGSRVKTAQTRDGKKINRSDDSNWKLGSFYYNPDDPAVFVEKRFGVGFTCNFARPLSWLFIIVLIGIIIGITLLASKLGG